MDSFEWDVSDQVFMSKFLLWNNNIQHDHEVEANLLMTAGCGGGGGCGYGGSYSENVFFNQFQEIQKFHPLNLDEKYQDFTRLATDASWQPFEFSYDHDHQSTVMINDQGGLQNSNFSPPPPAVTTTSLDQDQSLDCLFSAATTNTSNYTDTSIEDDGIFMIFSADRNNNNMWNNNSSGESKNKSSTKRNFNHFQIKNNNMYNGVMPTPPKKARLRLPSSSNINFQQPSGSSSSTGELDPEAIAQMKEMIYQVAAFRPVNLGLEVAEKPKRKNVRISSDPHTVAARQRRERISERIKVLQKLVPGGSRMDTASMLDEAANYVTFLRSQVKVLEIIGHKFGSPPVLPPPTPQTTMATNIAFSSLPFSFNHSFLHMQTQNPNNLHYK